MALPDFLCIGGMRCGSTTFWKLLRQHPRLFFPETKELHFFDDARGNYGKGLGWYEEQFRGAADGQLAGEVTPGYLHQTNVPDRLVAALPDARLLVLLRDSRKRLWSHYWFRVLQGAETLGFEAALASEGERLARGDADRPWRFAYTAWSRYVEGLLRYEKLLPRSQIHVLFLEELLKDPGAELQKVWSFLSIEEPEPAPELPPRQNVMRTPYVPALYSFAKRRIVWDYPRSDSTKRWQQRLFRLFTKGNLRPGTQRIPPEIFGEIDRRLIDADRRLAEWLGRPLPWR